MSTVWWPIMAAGCVIGVDLGGTKLLAGTVDSKLEVHHRAYRLARTDDTGALIDQLVEAVQEAVRGGARARCSRVGLGVPGLVDPATGVALDSNHLPLRGVAVRDLLAERLGLPVVVDNDANAAMLVEWRCGAARGAHDAIMLTLGTGIGGGLIVGGRLVHGAARRGRRARPHHRRRRRPAVPGQLPQPRLPGGVRVGARDRARGPGGVARSAPDSALGRALDVGARRSPARSSPSWRTTAIRSPREVMTLMGERLGLGVVTLVNIFNPEVVVVGGGAIAAGELLLAPAREVVARARAARSTAPTCGSCRPASAPSRGCSARRAWRSTWRGCTVG